MTDTSATTDGPAYTTEAYAAVEKAAKGRRDLYVPSVLEHAAELLTALWAAGEQHGVTPGDWDWSTSLGAAALDVVSRQYEHPKPERHHQELNTLVRHLLDALTSEEIGLTATLLSYPGVLVERGPQTPHGGYHGDADVEIRIYSDGGWTFSFAAEGASVVSIIAPASQAGASQVAEIVRAFVRGELANPFLR
ncbi:hypothetical protein [Streptomyces sp. NPDC088915]|uniref:hypothetical protein n=1 Tax=Streptomyces sp. NPDC088915 TaxID=3365912 RepID=UPI00381A31E5